MPTRDQLAERLPVPAMCHHRPLFMCKCGHDDQRHALEPAPSPHGPQVQAALESFARMMPERSTQPHRGCQSIGAGPTRGVRAKCACAFSRERVAELFPCPAWLIGDSIGIDVGVGLRAMATDLEIATATVSVWQAGRPVALAHGVQSTFVDGRARWYTVPLAATVRFVITGLAPGEAMIGIKLRSELDTPPRQYKIGELMIRVDQLAAEYLDRMCIGIDHELEATLDENIAANLGAWLRVFQDELARRHKPSATEAR